MNKKSNSNFMLRGRKRTLELMRQAYRRTGVLDRKFISPFEFNQYGYFQKSLSMYLFVIFFYITWSSDQLRLEKISKPFCVEPSNVTDSCSKECNQVQYHADKNMRSYISDFAWICNKAKILNILSWMDIVGLIAGGVLGYMIANRYGRKRTILLGLGIATGMQILILSFPEEIMIVIQGFVQPFYIAFIQFSSNTLILETLPSKYASRVISLVYISRFLSQFFSDCIWIWIGDWYKIFITRFVFTILLFFSSVFLVESPRWAFAKDKIDICINSMTKIAKTNEENVHGIEDRVLRAWRLSRMVPKASDSYFWLFKFPLVREVYLQVLFASLIHSLVDACASKQSKQSIYVQDELLERTITRTVQIVATLLWFYTLQYTGRKKPILIGFFILAGFLGMCIATRGDPFEWLFITLVLMTNIYIALHFEMIKMEALPSNLRPIILATDVMMKKVGSGFADELFTLHRAKWLPFAIAMILCLSALMIYADMVESKGSIMPITIRDAEMTLKKKILDFTRPNRKTIFGSRYTSMWNI